MALTPIIFLFLFVRLPRRDDPNHLVVLPVAMGYDQHPKSKTESQQQEAVFLVGMIGIEIEFGVIVEENGLRLLERYAVLAPILSPLLLVPNKTNCLHIYIVHILSTIVKRR
jgi:hypothetical protein